MLHTRNLLLRMKIFISSREPASKSNKFLWMSFIFCKKIIFIIGLALARKPPVLVVDSRSRSGNEGAVKIDRAEATMLLDPHADWLGNAIEAQIIARHVDFSQ